MPEKPNCFECEYRGTVPGSAHSRCLHPATKASEDDNPHDELQSILASVGRAPPVVDAKAATQLNIQGNPHGIKKGWFNWPFNFDPTWLENCDGFTPAKEGKNSNVSS